MTIHVQCIVSLLGILVERVIGVYHCRELEFPTVLQLRTLIYTEKLEL